MYDYANKQFTLTQNSQGHASTQTVMQFGPQRNPWQATYSGDNTKIGQVLIQRGEHGDEMVYQAVTEHDVLVAGRAQVKVDTNLPVTMSLHWQWLTGDRSNGISTWVLRTSEG